jgi:HTH-type transcriptional regulator/antitoxin HigA
MLAGLMEEHGLSQNQLASEGIADQGNLSNILAGDREISKSLAKRLAARFKVPADLFL